MDRYDHRTVERYASDVLQAVGVPREWARRAAESVVAGDLRGQGSQGIVRLPWVVEKIEAGEIDPTAAPEVRTDHGAVAVVDGQFALGQRVGRVAVDRAVEAATTYGVGTVALRNANDLGRVGEWAEAATEAGAAFVSFTNARGYPSVSPDGCAERLLGTNPFVVGFPTFDAAPFPVILDMATSQVSYGHVQESEKRGERLPPDWTTSGTGDPVRDPGAFLAGEGALLPFGGRPTGHKGFGLGIVNELMAGVLSEGTVAGTDDRPPSGNDATFVAFDPLAFTTVEAVERRVRDFVEYLRDADCPGKDAEPGSGVRFPGEGSHRTLRERRETGIPLPDATVDALCDLAADVGRADAVPPSFRGSP